MESFQLKAFIRLSLIFAKGIHKRRNKLLLSTRPKYSSRYGYCILQEEDSQCIITKARYFLFWMTHKLSWDVKWNSLKAIPLLTYLSPLETIDESVFEWMSNKSLSITLETVILFALKLDSISFPRSVFEYKGHLLPRNSLKYDLRYIHICGITIRISYNSLKIYAFNMLFGDCWKVWRLTYYMFRSWVKLHLFLIYCIRGQITFLTLMTDPVSIKWSV